MHQLLAQVDISQKFTPANKVSSVAWLVSKLGQIIAIIGAGFFVASIAYAGYLYLSSQGEQEKIKKASTMLTQSLIGLIIIAAAFWITQVVAKLLGQTFI